MALQEKLDSFRTDFESDAALNLYSALCIEGSVRSELSNTFTVYQPT